MSIERKPRAFIIFSGESMQDNQVLINSLANFNKNLNRMQQKTRHINHIPCIEHLQQKNYLLHPNTLRFQYISFKLHYNFFIHLSTYLEGLGNLFETVCAKMMKKKMAFFFKKFIFFKNSHDNLRRKRNEICLKLFVLK